MPKKGKKKAKVVEEDLDLEIVPRVEIVSEDTRSMTGIEPEFKWGKIYHMLQDQKIPDASLEDLPLFDNILRSGIPKVSTWPELFFFSEVIGWVLSKADVKGMIMYNVEDKGFSSFTPTFIAKYYIFPTSEVNMNAGYVGKPGFTVMYQQHP